MCGMCGTGLRLRIFWPYHSWPDVCVVCVAQGYASGSFSPTTAGRMCVCGMCGTGLYQRIFQPYHSWLDVCVWYVWHRVMPADLSALPQLAGCVCVVCVALGYDNGSFGPTIAGRMCVCGMCGTGLCQRIFQPYHSWPDVCVWYVWHWVMPADLSALP